MGAIIERNVGFIDRFIGDGVMAIFGLEDQPTAPLHAVNTGLQILAAADHVKPNFASMYDVEFDIRVRDQITLFTKLPEQTKHWSVTGASIWSKIGHSW